MKKLALEFLEVHTRVQVEEVGHIQVEEDYTKVQVGVGAHNEAQVLVEEMGHREVQEVVEVGHNEVCGDGPQGC